MNQIKIQIPNEFKELYNPKWTNLVLYGGRNSGKSYAVAQALLIRARKEKKRILCTREIQNTIKDSVHKLLADLIDKYKFTDYVVTKENIINQVTGSEFIFKGLRLNINEIKSTEGIDFCWVEEAQSVSEKSIEVLTPTIRKEGSQMFYTFNRFDELDPVFVKYVMNKPPNSYVAKINYDLLEKYGLLTKKIKDEIEFDKLNNPELYAHKWLGEPLSQGDFAIINRKDILESMERVASEDGQIEIGVDVARMGDDRTVIYKKKGYKTLEVKKYSKLRTTETCDLVEKSADYDKSITIKIDDTGVGGGVTDELMKRGYNVIPINFGGEPADKDKYPNLISEAWFQLASKIKEISLLLDQDLLMELSTRQWKQDTRGRRCIESKSEYKKRGFPSPDIADACIIAFYTPELTIPEITFI